VTKDPPPGAVRLCAEVEAPAGIESEGGNLRKGGCRGHAGASFEIVFFALAIPAFIADVLAGVSDRARRIGRISTGLLMLLGGAAVNAISLAAGVDYADFADDAKFGWVTDAWRAVVAPHDVLLIGLLVAFEATVGVMILSGGRLAQVGLVGAIAFHVCLALFFSWFLTVYGLAMLLPLVLLLRAERRAAAAPAHLPTAARDTGGHVGASRRA
jgi:hypothetical protein